MYSKWFNPQTLIAWLLTFRPAPVKVDAKERLRACLGMLTGIFITGVATRLLLGPSSALPMLAAPVGASSVLLFALPSSPLAQPWSIIGGNIASALIGVTCALFIPNPMLAAAVAGAGAIIAMFALRCVHPPSGAVGLMAVLGGPAITGLGYQYVLVPVAINTILLVAVALVYNNVTGRRYPYAAPAAPAKLPERTEARASDRLGFKPEDLDQVLKQYNQVLDVSRGDLESLLQQTEMHAYRRRFGEILCRDIMTANVVAVEFGTSLAEAWSLLRKNHLNALPVVNRGRRVIGIVSLSDFMQHADLEIFDTIRDKLRRLLQPSFESHSEKPEVVGQIMTPSVYTAAHDMHIVELVPLLSQGLHHIPVVDAQQHLSGMLTQSDLITALYRGRLDDSSVRTLGAA